MTKSICPVTLPIRFNLMLSITFRKIVSVQVPNFSLPVGPHQIEL